MERLSAEGHFFHRECFLCENCGCTLRLGTYSYIAPSSDQDKGHFLCHLHYDHLLYKMQEEPAGVYMYLWWLQVEGKIQNSLFQWNCILVHRRLQLILLLRPLTPISYVMLKNCMLCSANDTLLVLWWNLKFGARCCGSLVYYSYLYYHINNYFCRYHPLSLIFLTISTFIIHGIYDSFFSQMKRVYL